LRLPKKRSTTALSQQAPTSPKIKQQRKDDHARYIKSWLQALKNDKKFIFKASTQVQKAIDYLNDKAGV